MTKLTRSEQARINGKRSRGPVTEDGKARSARNSTKHGAYAKSAADPVHAIVLRNEDGAAFNDLLARLNQDLLPTNSFECSLVREVCAIEWLMVRTLAVQTHALDLQIGTETESIRRSAGSLRGISTIDVTTFGYMKLLDSSRILPHCSKEFSRLQKARREALNTLFTVRKHAQNVVRSEEPPIFQQLDFLNEPENRQPEPPLEPLAAAPSPAEPAADDAAPLPGPSDGGSAQPAPLAHAPTSAPSGTCDSQTPAVRGQQVHRPPLERRPAA